MRKASQKRSRRAEAPTGRIAIPWRQGDRVHWGDRAGIYRRDVDDQHAEIVIAERVYRVRRGELRPG